MTSNPTPTQLTLAKLAGSGLDAKDLKQLGIKPLEPAATHKLHESFKPVSSMVIPYYDKHGALRSDGFFRLRYLDVEVGFAAQAAGKKPIRYTQTPDTGVAAYFPPGYFDWASVFADDKETLIITEGELKAACSCKYGEPTIGLGGVFNWQSAKLAIPMLPELEDINWANRYVYLVFDSDFKRNPMVTGALAKLANELTQRGARVQITNLPEAVPGEKTGLDDYLVAEGHDAFTYLLSQSDPWGTSRDLWNLNNEVVYVRDPGFVVIQANGQKLAAGAFKEHAYADRSTKTLIMTVDKDGNEVKKLKELPLAPLWLKWGHRHAVAKMSYEPGRPKLHNNNFNTWPGWGCEPRSGDLSLWHELLDHVFEGAEPGARTWFEQWCAYPIQYPGTKLFSACVFWGRTQGTGKSWVFTSLGRVYGRNYSFIDQTHLTSPYNDWSYEKQFVLADDITGIGKERKEIADVLKSIVTRTEVRINIKFVPGFALPDCTNYGVTSNHPNCLLLEPTDRRWFVHEVTADGLPEEFKHEYDMWISSDRGAPALHHYLKHQVDVSSFHPAGHAFKTKARGQMIQVSTSDLGLQLESLMNHPEDVLRMGQVAMKLDLYTLNQLKHILDPEDKLSPNMLSRELRSAGFRQVYDGTTFRVKGQPIDRYWAVRNRKHWERASLAELQAHLEGEPAKPTKKKY